MNSERRQNDGPTLAQRISKKGIWIAAALALTASAGAQSRPRVLLDPYGDWMDDSMAALQELGRENQTLQVRAGARVSGEPDAAGACGSMGGAKTNH